MSCDAYTYVGAGGGQYVGCINRDCARIDQPIPCSDAVGAFKLVEYLKWDCALVERPTPECDAMRWRCRDGRPEYEMAIDEDRPVCSGKLRTFTSEDDPG